MDLAFATRDPSAKEVQRLKLLLSTYLDGTGNQRDKDGGTRASWREIERCVAELIGSATGEDKGIFDVVARDLVLPSTYYGYSVKSKEYGKATLADLDDEGRVYMEIANSPAKFWGPLHALDIAESDFTQMLKAQEIGESVLDTVRGWHVAGKHAVENEIRGSTLDLHNSCYLSITYSKVGTWLGREYQAHAFSLDFPADIEWKFLSPRCLRGYDPAEDEPVRLFDWYALSGGQLKYYPQASAAKFRSPRFKLEHPQNAMSVTDKARAYFPKLWPI